MVQALAQAAERAAPDNWPEAIATILIAVLSWWLSNKNTRKKTDRRR